MSKTTLYHGSTKIITKPIYHGGKPTNDYGYGFYCTESLDLAKEWASSGMGVKGYANQFELDWTELSVLDLTSNHYSVLNWLTMLLQFRQFDIHSSLAAKAKDFLIQHYFIDVDQFDVVIGYRADDSYFRFAKDFISNSIPIEKLNRAIQLGDLGKQVVLISQKAHERIQFIDAIVADPDMDYPKRVARDIKARRDYEKSLEEDFSGVYVRDLMVKENKK